MVDSKEAIRFFKVQLGRCKINLQGAKDRRDECAIKNIQHKMDVYKHTIEVLSNERNDPGTV